MSMNNLLHLGLAQHPMFRRNTSSTLNKSAAEKTDPKKEGDSVSSVDKRIEEYLNGSDNKGNPGKVEIASSFTEVMKEKSNIELNYTKEKLDILYEHEKNLLELIREYREEIKFVNVLQEDLRKERAKFFSETLREVSDTLSSAQVDSEVSSHWLNELVSSYTRSLDVSNGLVESNALEALGKIREKFQEEKDKL